jgi:hypothetical protein
MSPSLQSPFCWQQATCGRFWQTPLSTMQLSTVQAFWSLHWLLAVQQPATGVCRQRPWLTLQASLVHAVPSSQSLSRVQHPETWRLRHVWSTRLQRSAVHRTPSSQSRSCSQPARAERCVATSALSCPQAVGARTKIKIKMGGSAAEARL